ncbi:hypothetical protein RND81_04G050600 [Saponaria officinalis]|uniref:Uncharacterized protein n=1 Tax=Saponaria officinalis TaxID=3572 RepID=A0AAW1LIV0_SAPOF
MDDNNDYSCDDYNDDEDSEDAIDDAPYDDELEEDIGDPEDIADEMEEVRRLKEEARRLDDYEMMADAASLKGVEIFEPINPSTSTVLTVSEQGRRLRVSKPMYLAFIKFDRPTGEWRLKYGQHVGFSMRKFNINWNWKDVSEGKRKLMWKDTMVSFHLMRKRKFGKL